MAENGKDRPGVIAPPPVIYLGFLLLGLVADYFSPFAFLPQTLQYVLGVALIAVSGIVAALTFIAFHRARTSPDPYKADTALVTGGPFRFSRNPLYLAAATLYLGIAITVDSVWVVLALAPALGLINAGVIAREERYLEAKFGEDYARYKATVRRWI